MEKKRTQRIIGVLVIVALVIIVMPFLFSRDDSSIQEASNTKAPPFPDQQPAAVSAADNNNTTNNPTTAENTVKTDPVVNPDTGVVTNQAAADASASGDKAPDVAAANNTPAPTSEIKATDPAATATPAPAPQPTQADAAKATDANASNANSIEITPEVAKTLNDAKASGIIYERPKDTNQAIQAGTAEITADAAKPAEQQPVVAKPDVVTTAAVTSAPATTASADATKDVQPEKVIVQEHAAPKAKPAVLKEAHKAKKVKSIVAKAKKVKTTDLLNKTKAAWAIQMGSFKVKQNAINLANKLRAAGYKAFTREIKSASGRVSTRVYIGPEFKQASAAKLSSDVQHQMNMQGLVIPYKPLEL